jgi:gliding motility-associated-like protein
MMPGRYQTGFQKINAWNRFFLPETKKKSRSPQRIFKAGRLTILATKKRFIFSNSDTMYYLSSSNLRRSVSWQFRSILALAVLLLCGVQRAGAQSAVVCPPNIDFSFGTFQNWYCFTGTAVDIAGAPTASFGSPVLSGPVFDRHQITPTAAGGGVDEYGFFPEVSPGGGIASIKIGNKITGSQAERATYFVHVPVGFNNYSFAFRYAVVMEDPDTNSHTRTQRPAFVVSAKDSATGSPVPCATLTYVAGAGLPGFTRSTVGTQPWYFSWTNGTLNLSGQGGKTIIVEVTSYDCTQSGHFGYGYFDIVSCGQFAAAVTDCNLNKGYVQLSAPFGYASYKWYRGPVISGAPISQLQSFQLSPVPTTPTFYYCVITPFNSNGCPDTIRTRLISDFKMNASPDTVCNSAGKPIQLSVTASGGLDTFNYSWMANPTLSPGPDPLSGILHAPLTGAVTAAPRGSGFYVVTVTDTGGCYRSDTVVIQNPSFEIKQNDTTTCLHTPIRLNPRMTPANGPGYIFTWSPKAGLNDSTVLRPTFTPTLTGTSRFILRVDSGVCARLDTIDVLTLPDTFSVKNEEVCERAQIGAVVTSDPKYQDRFTYIWSPSTYLTFGNDNHRSPIIQPDTSITYAVTMRFPGCPDVTRNLSVRVEPNPRVNLGPDTMDKCYYTPLYLTANVTPTWFTNYSYKWRTNTDLDNTNTSLVRFTGTKDTLLFVEVSTPLNCKGRDSVQVIVHQAGFASVSPSNTAVCPNTPVTLTATGAATYQWVPGLYLDDSTAGTTISNPGTTTDYTLYATDKYGCTDTLGVHLQVFSESLVTLPDSAIIFPGDSYQMDPGGNALYFSWFPTVGLSNASISNPVATPNVNTRYYVTGTTEAGCVSTDSIYVLVHQESMISMPNAFSPGPGQNSQFKVAHAGIASLKSFRVYNRWGTKVFETKDINEGWDGRLNGESQPMGVYIYTVEAVDNNGKSFVQNGNVTLIR